MQPVHKITQTLRQNEPLYNVVKKGKRLSDTFIRHQGTLPSYVIIGVQKGGTTSLESYLSQHPDIISAKRKEVHFFTHHYHRGLKWYQSMFPELESENTITGDATPYYFYHPHAAKRLHKTLPDAKLILMLRDPVNRAFSHYNMEFNRGTEPLSFEDAIDAEKDRLSEELDRLQKDPEYYGWNHQNFSYIDRGKYAEQLEVWYRHFPKKQILIIKSEDFFENPQKETASVLDFLGMRFHAIDVEKKQNIGNYSIKIDPETEKKLRTYYAPHNKKLYKIIGRDLGW